MAYLDRIAAEHPADLIAAEVPGFLHGLTTRHPQFAGVACTYKQAAQNKALVEQVTAELRTIWRLAKQGDESWRERLTAINTEHRGHNRVASVRWSLIIEHSPRR